MRTPGAAVPACLAAILLLPGCWVWVDRTPGDISRSFAEARENAVRDRGRPRRVKMLIYDGEDDTLTRLSVPLWLVRKIAAHVDEEAREERLHGGEGADEDLEDLARFGLTLDQVLKSGPGLLVDVSSGDEQVLIWLE